jgi:hypothetical protein
MRVLPFVIASLLWTGCGATHGANDAGPVAHDAFRPPHDAFVPVDAFVPPDTNEDAWSAPDAWDGVCPTYTTDVQAIYQRHCATCHTTGRAMHFATVYTIASSPTSACGRTISMAQCTVQLGRPGGSMARNDPMGGFTMTELATLQAWITCGVPE